MCARRDGMTDLFEVFAHRRSVGIRHDDGGTGVTARANSTEQIGILIALIFWLPRTCALLGPLVDERVLLPNPHFILKPHLDRGSQRKSTHGLQHAGWNCAYTQIAYNSCRNRHCPKCQGAAAREWLAEREKELLPVPYFHVVFSLPAQIADIAYQNKAAIYGILFKASAETMLTIAADPKHLGARIGILSV